MSVFEYSSVFIAILAGQAVKEMLREILLIMKQDRWIRRLYAEWMLMMFYFFMIVGQFFAYFIVASDIESFTLAQFLVSDVPFRSYYFISCFAPCPHPNENILDIEVYVADNLPNAIHQQAIYLVAFPVFARLVFDPSFVFDRAYQIESGVGLIYIGLGFILRITIDKYGIREVKTVLTSVGVMLFALQVLTATVLEQKMSDDA